MPSVTGTQQGTCYFVLRVVSLETFDCDLDRPRYKSVYFKVVLAGKFVLYGPVVTVIIVLIRDPAVNVLVSLS